MKEPGKVNHGGLWSAFKNGGVPTAIASVFGSQNAQQIAFLRSLTKGQRKPETLHVPLTELKTAVFDLETTGFLYKQGDEILSFGAVKTEEGKVCTEDTLYSLARPTQPIPEIISELTGITQEIADQAPPLMEALHHFMTFIDDRVLVAHGSNHDKSFLDTALWKTSKIRLTHRVLDTMMIAQKLHQDQHTAGLDDWLKKYGIPITRRHHALEDAKMTAFLWMALVSQLREAGVVTLGDLYTYLSQS